MKKYFVALGLIYPLFEFDLKAQEIEMPLKPAQITGPMTYHSPDVASLGKFAMNAPNLDNGQIQHNIQLFNITENGITYPVSLNYGFSGFKPREKPNSAGMGWSVSEGTILRIIKGLPDENAWRKFEDFDYNNPLPGEPVSVPIDYSLPNRNYDLAANRVLQRKYDPQPDEYIYNFNGYSGRFIWVDNEAVLYPPNDLKITKYSLPNVNGFFFKASTPDGLEYNFQAMDETYNQHHWDATNEGYTDEYFAPSCGNIQSVTPYTDHSFFTGWRLVKIENLNSKEQINFEYDSYIEERHFEGNDCSSVTFYTRGEDDPDDGFEAMTELVDPHPGYQNTKNYYLTKIITSNFTYQYSYLPRADYSWMPGLSSIRIFNNLIPSIATKVINFNYYTPGIVHFLKQLSISGQGEEHIYKFDYTSKNATDLGDKGIDHWGYANGKQNTTLIPRTDMVTLMESSGAFDFVVPAYNPFMWADRNPDFNFAKNSALKEITYPTGGKSTITYESAGGRGIRVRSISDYDPNSNISTTKYYTYYPDNPVEAPSYHFNDYKTLTSFDYCPPYIEPYGWYARRYFTLTATSNSTLDFFDQSINFYSRVTEYLGSSTGANGRTEYNFVKDFPTGTTHLTEQNIYNNTGDLVKKTENTYEKIVLKGIHFWGTPILFQPAIVQPCLTVILAGGEPCDGHDPYFQFSLAQINGLSMTQEQLQVNWWKKTQTLTYDYATDNSDHVVNTTKLFYQPLVSGSYPKYLMPNRIEKYSSNGDIEELRTYYVNDPYTVSPGVILLGPSQMWLEAGTGYKHMTAFPMKMIKSINGVKKEELTYNYAYDAVKDEVNLVGSNVMVDNETIKSASFGYATGNRLNLVEENGLKSALLRDYNQQYIVTRAINADQGAIAYCSFEGNYTSLSIGDQNKGNWDFDKNKIVYGGFSGTRAISLGSGDFVRSNASLASGKLYTVSFWVKGSTNPRIRLGSTLLSQSYASQKTAGAWRYYSITVTGNGGQVSVVPETGALGDMIVDELRLYPQSARMQSYTYDPATGNVTTVSDESGTTVFYSYDGLGRLEAVRDEAGHILKKHSYQLFNQN